VIGSNNRIWIGAKYRCQFQYQGQYRTQKPLVGYLYDRFLRIDIAIVIDIAIDIAIDILLNLIIQNQSPLPDTGSGQPDLQSVAAGILCPPAHYSLPDSSNFQAVTQPRFDLIMTIYTLKPF
jgi:hypothetical protein